MERKNHREIGRIYEEKAVDFLREKGYEILEKNFRCPWGEIDVIAKYGDCLVFVEVKYRGSQRYGTWGEAVDGRKQRRISRAALVFCGRKGYGDSVPCRFDVVGVDGRGVLTHIENAFDYRG